MSESLAHEHDFIPVEINKENCSYVQCVTCNSYFCQSCGKLLNKVNHPINRAKDWQGTTITIKRK